MQYGFVKVCAATTAVRVADVKFNTDKIISAIKESYKNGSKVTVFPELCLSGYTCGDLFNQGALLSAVERAIHEICMATATGSPLVFLGAPLKNNGKLYNCAVVLSNGKILGIVPKTYLPTYGEFYERRHFSPAEDENSEICVADCVVPFGKNLIFQAKNDSDFTVACEICEDLWAPDSPSVKHAQAGADIIVNLSCSDETVGKSEYRRQLVSMQSGKLVACYVYADSGDGESTTDMVFAGHNIIAENGRVLKESELFKNGLIYADVDVKMLADERRRMSTGFYSGEVASAYKTVCFTPSEIDGKFDRVYSQTPFVPEESEKLAERTELILSIQAKGLAQRILHTKAETVVLGISGGLDSALALLVACRAFGLLGKNPEKIIAVTMPGFGTTKNTKNSSVKLISSLGVSGKTVPVIPIKSSVLQHFKDIGHNPERHDVTYENAQARMRTMILMDIANSTRGFVVGTGDLSELALGWATYNGDHMSMYAVNSSVPKTLVKHLVAYEAKRLGGEVEKVLNKILNTEISPELLPPDKNGKITQKTEDIVGPYILHDFFLYYAIRWGFSPDKMYFIAQETFGGVYDGQTIKKWLKNFYKRFFSQQFKRSCIPDGVKVGSVTLSPRGDWRMPSDAAADLWLEIVEKL